MVPQVPHVLKGESSGAIAAEKAWQSCLSLRAWCFLNVVRVLNLSLQTERIDDKATARKIRNVSNTFYIYNYYLKHFDGIVSWTIILEK